MRRFNRPIVASPQHSTPSSQPAVLRRTALLSEEPCYFCFGCMFPCCAAFHLRQKILGENFESEYSCCQVDNLQYTPCCGPGGPCCDLLSCWKSCPTIALCTEAWCCTGLSLSFTRIHAMHKFNVRPDPMDYTCIQFCESEEPPEVLIVPIVF